MSDVLWVVTPCALIGTCHCFVVAYCLHLQNEYEDGSDTLVMTYKTTCHHNSKDCHQQIHGFPSFQHTFFKELLGICTPTFVFTDWNWEFSTAMWLWRWLLLIWHFKLVQQNVVLSLKNWDASLGKLLWKHRQFRHLLTGFIYCYCVGKMSAYVKANHFEEYSFAHIDVQILIMILYNNH